MKILVNAELCQKCGSCRALLTPDPRQDLAEAMPELAYGGYYVERIDEEKLAEAMRLCPAGALTII